MATGILVPGEKVIFRIVASSLNIGLGKFAGELGFGFGSFEVIEAKPGTGIAASIIPQSGDVSHHVVKLSGEIKGVHPRGYLVATITARVVNGQPSGRVFVRPVWLVRWACASNGTALEILDGIGLDGNVLCVPADLKQFATLWEIDVARV